MEVTLTPELESVLNRIVQKTGKDKSEVLQEALDHWLVREEKITRLRADVQVGLDQIERGEYTEYTKETLHDLISTFKRESRTRRSGVK
jgi:antitoxin ParD1/3/4